MKPKSIKDYIKFYEEKTKDKFVVRKNYVLFFLPERGVMTATVDAQSLMLVVEYVIGDIHFWRDFAELKCREMGLEYIGTFCNRNIDAYLRNFGAEILCEQNIDGKRRLLCQDNIGRKVVVTHHIDRDKGLEPQYLVTQYLNEKATTSWNFLNRQNQNKKGDE